MTSAKCLFITKGSNAIGAIIGAIAQQFSLATLYDAATWAIAQQFSLATLYDAAFLAVAELESAQFSTADESLLNTLTPCPAYVQKLGA